MTPDPTVQEGRGFFFGITQEVGLHTPDASYLVGRPLGGNFAPAPDIILITPMIARI